MAENSNCTSVVINLEDDDGDSAILIPKDKLCEVCYLYKPLTEFTQFSSCGHQFCLQCVKTVFETNVMASRVDLQCLYCTASIPQSEIRHILTAEHYDKYLGFTLRKFLATQQPDICHCLTPNCPYACINSCPEGDRERSHFVCGREECLSEYCNMCKKAWHPNMTCEEFEVECPGEPEGIPEELRRKMGTKNCPSCDAIIQKTTMDGSCNQVVCAVCHTSFCWLCGKPVTEMHFMSPTGCPLYGNKRWTKRKRWCCRLWLWLMAPLLTIILTFVVIPVVLIAFPLVVGYKVYKYCKTRRHKVVGVILTLVIGTICVIAAPLVAILASLLVFPLTLLYFYCFIPINLCSQSS